MSKIDLKALSKTANAGEGKDRVGVSRLWLRAVLEELRELERLREKDGDSVGAISDIVRELFGKRRA